MSTPVAQWFVITRGEFKGRPHLNGWTLSAIKGEAFGSDDGWLAYGHCPRCHAMVCTDKKRDYDNQWAHEAWHAATDFPIPDDVAQAITDEWKQTQ